MTRALTSSRAVARTAGMDQPPAADLGTLQDPASIPLEDLKLFVRIRELYENHSDPMVRCFAALGYLAQEELDRRAAARNAS